MIRRFFSGPRTAALRRRGFSLIEVNMAIFVLAGGALALLGLFPLGLRYSQQANAEMRTTAFAQRFLGAVRVAAMDPENRDEADLASAVSSEFGIRVGTAVGDGEDLSSVHKDETSKVWYRAWIVEDDSGDMDMSALGRRVVQAGVQVTTENWDQNKRAFVGRPVSVVKVMLGGGSDTAY